MQHQERQRRRLRLGACCALLVGIAFIQTPGLIVSDTKFDLAVTPLEFLRRALHLWDPSASLGQLQDQSYGYLWPTGPFFLLGHGLGLPAWVVQRLWFAVVLVVAFLGAAKVVRALGARTDLAVLVSGFAYALSPALLTKIGPISSEAWPFAVAPWVLLPLILGSRAGSPRRFGILAGVAVSMVGGINAAATAAVLPLGVVWLLTRSRGRRRWSLLGWWTGATLIGTLWWLGPLLILGTYSPPFLDFIESADTTTFANNVVDALRGTTDWVAYLDPSWQAGHELVITGFLAVDIAVVVAVGLVGIAHRDQPHRLFLLLSLLVGLLITTMGHQTGAHGWLAGSLHELLDTTLAPIRNLHKFDPVIRLPLVIGLSWAVDVAVRSPRRVTATLPGRSLAIPQGKALAALVCLAAFASAMPAWAGRLAPTSPVASTPGYWSEAVSWVNGQHRGVALMTPGSSFGHYLWGSPDDEPMQYLDARSWAVRSAVPLAPPGTIRMLDAVEARLAQGRSSAGLAGYLRRAGVGLLVVRNDLAPDGDVPDDALALQALSGSPGIRLVKAFGPDVGGAPVVSSDEGRILPDAGWRRQRRALEVYAVDGTAATESVATDRAPVVVGGPEDILDLQDDALVGDEPTVLASDLASTATDLPTGPVLLTDGMLDREQTFGRTHDAQSAVRTPGDVRRTGNRVRGYEVAGRRWQTTSRLVGASAIAASSSMSDATAPGGAVPGDLPFAAVDADRESEWVSSFGAEEVPWWRLDLGRAVPPGPVTITLGHRGAASTSLRLRTAGGVSARTTFEAGETHTLTLPAGTTDWLRVEGEAGQQLALADVALAGVTVRRQVVLPSLPDGWPDPEAIVLRALDDARTGCVAQGRRVPCLAERARPSEEPSGFERVLALPSAATWAGSLQVRARPGPALDTLLTQGYLTGATASSEGVPDARASVIAALDGRPGTTWVADVDDPRPSIDVHWVGTRTITGITAQVGRAVPARRPTTVRVTWPGGREDVTLDADGHGTLAAPIRTAQLTVAVTASQPAVWSDEAELWHDLPVGISRLRFDGLPSRLLALSTETRDWGCGSGPVLSAGGRVLQSRLLASPADLYAMTSVPAVPCGPLTLPAGSQVIAVSATDAVAPVSLVLRRAGGTPVTTIATSTIGLGTPSPVARTLRVPRAGLIADQRENGNRGWVATQGRRTLKPVVLDGWRQGWLTAGEGRVEVRFAPDRTYRLVLASGLGALLLLWLLALRRRWGEAELAAVGEAAWPAPVIVLLGGLAAGLLAGWIGVAALLAGALLGGVVSRRGRPEAAWAVTAGLILVDGAAYALHPVLGPGTWAGDWAWPSYLALGALGVVLGSLVDRWPTRVRGRSTKR